jgi:hypothetical protein
VSRLNRLIDVEPDGSQVIVVGSVPSTWRHLMSGLVLSAMGTLLLIRAWSDTSSRIWGLLCVGVFGLGTMETIRRIIRRRAVVRWGSWGLSVYPGRRVAWPVVRSMQAVTVFGARYLGIWLYEPDALDPTVSPWLRRLRWIRRHGHMTVPASEVGGRTNLEELLERLETVRAEALGQSSV